MQKVAAKLPSWDKTKTQSKKGFDKVWGWADKLGAPVNRFTNRIGSEAFWPTTLDKESYKAARILRSFCKDGFYTEEECPSADQAGPKQKQRVLKKIPQEVIRNAVGLAIFTTMRTGLWISGAGGSGVLVARKEDGSWSPPSGILLHTAGLGFLVGVDIYDCVLVINNRKALEAFTKIRATLGGEISAVAGPVGAGGVLEHDGKWKQVNRPVFTYLKSRGFYAGVQVDGSIVIERTDENARFYGQTVGVADILAGKVRHPPPELKMLFETLKSAEGRTDVDTELMEELKGQPAPGDVSVDAPGGRMFGIPELDDPDPYGALALEKEGLEIREAGTRSRPSSRHFEFNPSPSSPIYDRFYRRSADRNGNSPGTGTRSNRESYGSTSSSRARWSTDRPYFEAWTQTGDDGGGGYYPGADRVSWRDSHHGVPPRVYGDDGDGSSELGEHGEFSREYEFVSDGVERGDLEETASATVSAPGVVNNTPRRVPPPLPPRNDAVPPISKPEFEEVSLEGAEREEI